MRPDLSPRDRDLELERAYSVARVVGAIIGLLFAPFMDVSYPAVVVLDVYLAACGFGLAYLWRTVGPAQRIAVRWVALILDIVAATGAIVILANDPTWAVLLIVPLLVFVSTLRCGVPGGLVAVLSLSVAHVVTVFVRHDLFGYAIDPARIGFQIGMYWLALILVAGTFRELANLQAMRADLVAPLLLAQQQVGDAVLIRDDERYIFVGDAIRNITGHAPDEFARLDNILDLVPTGERAAVTDRLSFEGPDRFETHLVHRDGRHVPVEVVRTSVARDGGRRVVAIVRDITERRAIAESLEFTATHDQLTGLPNRVFILRAIDAVKEDRAAVLLIDLSHFGDVNETFGHAASDELLRHVAVRVRSRLRSMDVLGHIGADDFAVVLPGADVVGATRLARDLATAFAEPFDIVGRPLLTAANFAIAVKPDHASDAASLLRCGEVALADAPTRADGIAVYDAAADSERAERMTLLAELQDVVARGGLTVSFQPAVDVRSGAPLAFEALARWDHPRRGHISPATFVPLAEYSGLITRVTRHVLAAAIAACRSWHEAGERLRVAVNVSVRDLSDPDFPSIVRDALAGFDARSLIIEVTESLAIADRDRVVKTLANLRAMGVQVALDDFGSGLSSLTQLHDLPVTQVKLDQVFAQRLGADGGVSVARAAIELAHALGLEVVAEGVEDRAALERLGDLGCDQAQGFHIAAAMPRDEIIDWVRARRRRQVHAVPA